MNIGEVLRFLASPVIGGCIGYFTNYIASKMLFHPRTEIKIAGHVLPFTPGIIPKRKDKLARAIGETVARKVFTSDDIEEIFLSEEMRCAVVDSLIEALGSEEQMHSMVEMMEGILSEEEQEQFLEQLDQIIYKKVHHTMLQTDIAGIVSEECQKIIREKSQGAIASKVMTQTRISSISERIGAEMQQYAKDNIEGIIMPVFREETAQLMVKPINQVMEEVQVSTEELRRMIGKVYDRFIREHSAKLVRLFDIAGLTEQKIIAFQTEEIEEMINETVHREMQALVNLGGVLGVLIGFVNSFIQM